MWWISLGLAALKSGNQIKFCTKQLQLFALVLTVWTSLRSAIKMKVHFKEFPLGMCAEHC